MAPRPRSIERVLELQRADIGAPEFQKWHAAVARTEKAIALAQAGDDPRVETFVDGRKDADESSVRYRGVIRYEFIRSAQAVADVLGWLRAEGNKVSTKYGEAFAVGVIKAIDLKLRSGTVIRTAGGEGRMIPAARFNPNSKGIPADAGFIIVNTKSWSRKVDVQMIGMKPMVFSIPPFIMERAAVWLRSRNPELVVRRWYTSEFTGQYILQSPGRRSGERVHSPALLIARADI
jgi:hypothetical protein